MLVAECRERDIVDIGGLSTCDRTLYADSLGYMVVELSLPETSDACGNGAGSCILGTRATVGAVDVDWVYFCRMQGLRLSSGGVVVCLRLL